MACNLSASPNLSGLSTPSRRSSRPLNSSGSDMTYPKLEVKEKGRQVDITLSPGLYNLFSNEAASYFTSFCKESNSIAAVISDTQDSGCSIRICNKLAKQGMPGQRTKINLSFVRKSSFITANGPPAHVLEFVKTHLPQILDRIKTSDYSRHVIVGM